MRIFAGKYWRKSEFEIFNQLTYLNMRVVQSCIGKFHHFHLARQLYQRDSLECIFTGYPWFKLKNERLPREKVRSFPWLQTPYMAFSRYFPPQFSQEWAIWSHRLLDVYASRHLPKCNAFIGLSGAGLQTGKKAKQQGAIYVCDRGSSHIRFQAKMLKEECSRWKTEMESVHPKSIVQEEQEYEAADFITVPSEFVRRSFIKEGVPQQKVVKIPYGADISRFKKVADVDPDVFTILFVGQVSIRKGIFYLLEAFQNLPLRKKRLIIIGLARAGMKTLLSKKQLDDVEFLGHVPNRKLREFYSLAHVFVLASIEEGLAYVLGEAMACGCPIIATENTGAEDLFENGSEGFIVPPRDPAAITEKLQQFRDDEPLRQQMSLAAIERAKHLGGWNTYGNMYYDFLRHEIAAKKGRDV